MGKTRRMTATGFTGGVNYREFVWDISGSRLQRDG